MAGCVASERVRRGKGQKHLHVAQRGEQLNAARAHLGVAAEQRLRDGVRAGHEQQRLPGGREVWREA